MADHDQDECGCGGNLKHPISEQLRRKLRSGHGVRLTGNASEVDYFMQQFVGVECYTKDCLASGNGNVTGLSLPDSKMMTYSVCSYCADVLRKDLPDSFVLLPNGDKIPVWE